MKKILLAVMLATVAVSGANASAIQHQKIHFGDIFHSGHKHHHNRHK